MKIKKCNHCTYYSAYYKQLPAWYAKLKNGFCKKHKSHKIQTDTCEIFKCGDQNMQLREELLLNSLGIR